MTARLTTYELREGARRIGAEIVSSECLNDLARGNSEGNRLRRVVDEAQMALYYLLEDYQLGWGARRRVKKLRRELIEAAKRPRVIS